MMGMAKAFGSDVIWRRQPPLNPRMLMGQCSINGIVPLVVGTGDGSTIEEQERAEPVRVFDVNTGRTLNLLEAARRRGLQRFVYVSTGGLYGPGPGRTGAR